VAKPKQLSTLRRCTWTGLPLPPDQPRVRVHPAFRRVTRTWPRPYKERYAALVRQLGTLHHGELRALATTIRGELRDAEAQRLDRKGQQALERALQRDQG
jgi:hypothetical protein